MTTPETTGTGQPGSDGQDQETLELRLYVAGQSPRSVQAIENLRRVCEEFVPRRYNIELIDLVEHPRLARGDEIIAVPTLVRRLPEPIRKIIDDLSDTETLLVGLQIRSKRVTAVSEDAHRTTQPVPRADAVSVVAADWAERETALLREIGDLSAALDVIRISGIDAVMIPGPQGDNLYTLTSADRPYRVLVEEMGEGAATLSERGTVLYANQRFADLLGRDRARLLGLDLTDLVQTRDSTVLGDLLATAPGTSAHEEVTLVHPDGSTTPVLASITGLDLDGTVVHCLIVADLTSRVEAEERFRLTLENSTIGVTLETPEGRFLLVNPALCQMLGRDAKTLMAMTWQDVTHPDDVTVGEGLIADLAEGKIPSFRLRKRYLTPDGSVLWGDLSLSCVRNDDGSVRNFIAQIMDVSEQVRATQRLAESEEHYRLLAENASDFVAQASLDGAITWVSPSVTRTLGWAPEDLLGTQLDDLVHPDDAVATQTQGEADPGHERTARTDGSVVRIRAKSGQYRWMSAFITAMQDKSGVDVTVVSSLRDVDDLVQTREAAEADRAVLRATVDSLLDPQVQLDPVRDEARQIVDFVYVDANPAACAYNGMAYQDLVGARLLDLFPGHAGAGLLDQYRHVLETSEPLVLDDFVYAQELMGGTERRYDIRAARVNGGLTYTWRDVTDRYMAAQTLAESEEQYRFLAENASDVVMRLSPDRRHELVSGSVADVLGWQAPDLVGHLIDEFIHPDDLPSFRQVVADAAPGCAARVEFRFRRSDGTYRWVACRTRTKVDEDGTPVSMVGGLVDISDRKAAEAEERKRLQELECFQRLTVGRELKMIELKKEIEYLKKHISAKGSDPRDQFET